MVGSKYHLPSSISSRAVLFLFAGGIAVLLSAQPAHAATTFSDGTFNLADWQTTTLFKGNGGTIDLSHQSSGGNPDAFLRIDHVINPAPAGPVASTINGFYARNAASYDPALNGAVLSVDFSIDYKNINTALSGMAFGLALRQDGQIYNVLRTNSGTVSGWQTDTRTALQATDFGLTVEVPTSISQDFSQNPDFSAAGSPMEFGFFTRRANTTTDEWSFQNVGFDNWSVTVHEIPEPASLALLALGTLYLRRSRRNPR